MTEQETALKYDEEVITIGPAEVAKGAATVAARPRAAEANSRAEEMGARAGLVQQTGIDERVGADERRRDVGQDVPAASTRKVVFGLAVVGVLLIITYVLDYWGIIQLPF
jgi:hypothetical protein